jgi:AP endonuclease-2
MAMEEGTGWQAADDRSAGYSGVAIYTRNAVCAPIRAEEGITGILTPPNSSTSFWDLPKDQQIGGYPTPIQLAECPLDIATLDSEGRCVVLEFPAFVLIGVYCPASRNETRDDFRIAFINALDARVRNLVKAGKRVLLTGDLNIIREELDTANAEEQLKKHGMTGEQYVSTPSRRMLNQLLVGGKVFGERDEGREKPVMWDICRSFHPDRPGMFTCWEQKINARPGNFGSRIDYVLCSQGWKDWFCESNIQEGLMGSDHCPVYAALKQKVEIGGEEVDIRDIMSAGMFESGVRQREWTTKDLLPLSAKLIPEFDRRRNIRDMFVKKPSMTTGESSFSTKSAAEDSQEAKQAGALGTSQEESTPPADSQATMASSMTTVASQSQSTAMASPAKSSIKRAAESSSSTSRPLKKGKSGAVSKTAPPKGQSGKGQSSLMGFFKPKVPQSDGAADSQSTSTSAIDGESDTASGSASDPPTPAQSATDFQNPPVLSGNEFSSLSKPFNPADQKSVVDPIVAKESWSKLLGKRKVPRCEHNEPCISLITKKVGENQGRSFYMCPRPIGPTGQKERNTQWRCGTFIWSSDWTGDGT